MRPIGLILVLVVACALPAVAEARAWKGINPGATAQAEVVEKFGEPTTKTKRTGRTVLAYYGDQAPDGTRQAQFHVDAQGMVVEITIFLTAHLDAETIEGTYGKPPQKTFVEDTFQKVWLYPSQGVTVYFTKEGTVEALSFAAGTKGQPKPAAGDRDPTPAAAR
ncbi:MAG TPA: hypothetical protein VF875_16465 [Anaeromyxobacter sp.]